MKASETQSILRDVISIFILFNLIAIVCWAVPMDFSLTRDVKSLVRPYLLWTGLFQSWDTFAPNPKSTNSYLEAIAITQSHQQKVWVFPRMEQLSFGERYRKERYRKFAEVLVQPSSAPFWPDVSRHVAGMFDNPSDPPTMILLVQFQSPIKLGAKGTSEPVYKPNIFYEYVNSVPSEGLR